MFERFTVSSRRVIVLSRDEALRLRSAVIGTEHLLLALAQEGLAAQVLRDLGVPVAVLRRRVEDSARKALPPGPTSATVPFAPECKKALGLALREALELRDQHIDSGHLLLGVFRQGKSAGAWILADLGIAQAAVRARILEIRDLPRARGGRVVDGGGRRSE